ncbi:hypothetical protein KFU94_68795 [Chloroflexi bacterium TSY]|nr:hypothetical protein [Chloroflexi bacterium TSY]
MHHAPRMIRSRPEATLLAIILVVAFVLRFWALDASSLWSDEGNTWALIRRSYTQIARDAAADIHPPGYYWLLKTWTLMWPQTAFGMRSFSALCGTLLVYIVYRIGLLMTKHSSWIRTNWFPSSFIATQPHNQFYWFGLLAAWISALAPFQIYYSQEARMYILLALESGLLFWALLALIYRELDSSLEQLLLPATGFVASGIAGLWTHYSFPVILAAAGLTYLVNSFSHPWRLLRYGLLNLFILIAYLPWLPTAIDRVLNWPQVGQSISWEDGLALTLRTLTFGPLRNITSPHMTWLVVAGVLPIVGSTFLLWHDRRAKLRNSVERAPAVALSTWFLGPIILMFALGLFRDAFFKFLLVASPAWALLMAAAPFWLIRSKTFYVLSCLLLAIGASIMASVALPDYYRDPTARDNYRGVSRYLAFQSDMLHNLVLLNAPGQQEVWEYYNPGFPVLALPTERPPNPLQTISRLERAVEKKTNIYALFWATNESDPESIVENWLDRHSFRGLDSWQGNMRFVTYARPSQLICQPFSSPVTFANKDGMDQILLLEQCQPAFPQQIASGQVALIGLQWQIDEPIKKRYKVTLQLLDARQQVIAQRDSEPVGGSLPTDAWQPHTIISDNHGIVLPPGTPPGNYRLILALYETESGQRLQYAQTDFFELGTIEITKGYSRALLEITPMMVRLRQEIGPLILEGYDVYRKGSAHQPETPVAAGDPLHYTLYWGVPDPRSKEWPDDLTFTMRFGQQTLIAPLAGGSYPTSLWDSGDLVRGEFDIIYDGTDTHVELQVEDERQLLNTPPLLP